MMAGVIGLEEGALPPSAQSGQGASQPVGRFRDNPVAAIVRRFGIARTVVVVLYVAAVLSGATTSSLGISSLRVNPGAPTSDQIGTPLAIRTDEWLTETPLDLATLTDGTRADTPLSTSADLLSQIPSNLPESVVFWDGDLLRLGSVFPSQMLFAAWWWLPTLLVLLCLPPLLMRLGATRELAWLAAVVTVAAPASAWWSLSPVRLLGFAIAGCLAMLVAADRLGERRYARAALFGAIAAVLFSRLPTSYVPWALTTAVPLVLATTGLLVWSPRNRLSIVGLSVGVLLGAALLWGLMALVDSAAVHAELNTVYPGLRRETGMLQGPHLLFGAPVLGYLQTGNMPVGTNQSELSSAYTFAAVWAGLLWLAVKRPRWDRTAVPAAVLAISCVVLLIWCLVNLGSFGEALPLLNRIIPSRAAQTVGYPAFMLLTLVLGRTESLVPVRVAAAIAAACGLLAVYGGSGVQAVMPSLPTSYVVLASVVVVLVVFVVTCWPRSPWVALGVGVIVVAQVITVNPLIFGLGDLHGSSAARRAVQLRREAIRNGSYWVTDSMYTDALMLANGVPLLSGHQLVGPVTSEWLKLDPDRTYETAWNRGASYLIFVWTSSQTPVITNPDPDVIQVSVDPCTLRSRGFNLAGVVSTASLHQACLVPERPFTFSGTTNYVYALRRS